MLQAAAPFSTTPIPAHAPSLKHSARGHIDAGIQMLDAMIDAFERTADYEEATFVLLKGFQEMIQQNFCTALEIIDGEGDAA